MPWDLIVVSDAGILAVHAALLPTGTHGRIVYFGGRVDDTRVYEYADPPSQAQVLSTVPPAPQPVDWQPVTDLTSLHEPNAFCSGHAFLADGRLLVAGGHLELYAPDGLQIEAPPEDDPVHPHGGMAWGGERRCSLFAPRAGVWRVAAPLRPDPAGNDESGGRWYPTLVTLGAGDVIAVGGHPDRREEYPGPPPGNRHSNNTPERYNATADEWVLLASDPPTEDQVTAATGEFLYDYQRTHLLPDGRVFFVNPVRGKNRVYRPNFATFSGGKVVDLVSGGTPADAVYLDTGFARYTSVLLPLLHQEGYRPRVLLFGGETAFRIDLDDASPQWQPTGGRDWSAAPPVRSFVCPVILPTGRVFFSGGTRVDGSDAVRQQNAVREGEIYAPGIDWEQGTYGGAPAESWETVEAAAVHRHYHSTALLLPDGAVWTAGSNGPSEAGGSFERRIEIYRPSYGSNRPTITACPPSIGYGYSFEVETPQAQSISRVALIRCGSVTHGFNPDQRYVTVPFTVKDANTLEIETPTAQDVLPPGYYLLWILDSQSPPRPCVWASFIRLSDQKALVSSDVSTYSVYEVQGLGTPATFTEAVYLVYDGFLPHEVVQPTVSLALPGVQAKVRPPLHEGNPLDPDVAQRIVYPVDITFTSEEAFGLIPAGEDFAKFLLRARMRSFPSQAELTLSKRQNPRMRDGEPPWVSIDVRAFWTRPGETATAGVTHPGGEDGPFTYIKGLVQKYNEWDTTPHPFDDLPYKDLTGLPLYPADDDGPVFSYALARVRFIAPEGINATDVRVFFRLWTTGWTALSYEGAPSSGSYRRAGSGLTAAPLLGLSGSEINNIPCFAEPRHADMTQQTDDTNVATLKGADATEVFAYFGCWLDLNQDTPRFPIKPVGDGPFSGDLKSIRGLMRGLHQCLVAELHYTLDPIDEHATPTSSDNLAQRNLVLDAVPNPGGATTRLAHHTFEIKPSPTPFPSLDAPAAITAVGRQHPDELCFAWGNLPRDSHVTLYLPQVNVDEVLRFAARRQGPGNLAKAGEHTLTCRVTDVGFIPIPGPFATNLPALLSIQLPPGLVKGQRFSVVVRQVDGRRYRVVGTTQFDIRVDSAAAIVPSLTRNLSVLKHIALQIPKENRWYPVFVRYLDELGERLRGMGVDPDDVPVLPGGGERPEDRPGDRRHTGRVKELVYDCAGAFEGFVLDNCGRSAFFRGCEPGLEEVIRRACKDRSKVTVHTCDDNERTIRRLAVHCC